jgi:homoserine dehydrogenase
MRELRIGLLGCGTVGRGLCELIGRNAADIAERTGRRPSIALALVRDARKPRPDGIETTDDPERFRRAPVDIVVELAGGIEPARGLLLEAISRGRPVVTANKALLAEHAGEIFDAARRAGVGVGFEAAVCGGVPIVRALASGLAGDRVTAIEGIVNGTANFILTRIEEGSDPDAALEEARRRGLAEADPSLDLDGVDAAQKIRILARLAFGATARAEHVAVRGIRGLGLEDARAAAELGGVVRLVASAWRGPDGAVRLRVEPCVVPRAHPLAGVREENNAVRIRSEGVGDLLLAGRGAGPQPTAAAVLADILDVAAGRAVLPPPNGAAVAQGASIRARFLLRVPIRDVPGVIGLIATALGNRGISISWASATLQPASPGLGQVRIATHETDEPTLGRAVAEIARLPVAAGPPVVMRILPQEGR